jgi:uncharacterized membrane protein YphA (DoxX/SURF4 family)
MERKITNMLARISLTYLRIGMGILFLWFGVLKFFPGINSAEDLAVNTIQHLTFSMLAPDTGRVLLAILETFIGIGLLTGKWTRLTLLLLAFQMLGTLAPIILFPGEVFEYIPYAPTTEGRNILKNFILIGAGLVLGATLRGGRIEPGT